jgi:type I restriction enzyme M protein
MHETKILINLFDKTTNALRTMGFRESSFADFIFTFLFWKYLSDTKGDDKYVYPGIKADFNLVKTRTNDLNLTDEIKFALKEWSSKNNFDDIMELNFNPMMAHLLPGILQHWSNAFDQLGPNFWINENIKLSHDILNDYLSSHSNDAHLLFTPLEIQKLITNLIDKSEKTNVYDPFCRSGGLLFAMTNEVELVRNSVGIANDLTSYKAAKIYSLMIDQNCDIKMESISQLGLSNTFDIIITNPPFGKVSIKDSLTRGYWSTTFQGNRFETIYLTHCLDHLSDKGQAAIIVSKGFLTWSDKTSFLRKAIVEKNLLEAVIELPQKMFFGTGTSAAILILNKQKVSDKVIIINASQMGSRENDRVRFTTADIDLIIDLVQTARKNRTVTFKESFVGLLSREELMQQECKFAIGPKAIQKVIRPSSADVFKECALLQSKIVGIQRKIEELRKAPI